MNTYNNTRELLEALVNELTEYNDIHTGYLNGIAVQFNKQLEQLELPTIGYCAKYPIEVTYSSYRQEVEVYHPASDTILFYVKGKDLPEDIDIIASDPVALQHWIEEDYNDILNDTNF